MKTEPRKSPDYVDPTDVPADTHSAGNCSPSGHMPLISLVVPCFNEQEVLPLLIQRLSALIDGLYSELHCDSEVLLIDDGSQDRTWELIRHCVACDHRIRGIRFTRNFGQQAAITCGYALARGDATVILDADLQDPPEIVPEMVRKWQNGADVVYAIRCARDGESPFKLLTAKFFYHLVRLLGASHVRCEAGEFRLISLRARQAILQLNESNRFMRGLIGWLGFPAAEVHYHRPARAAGQTKWPLRKMLRLAADAIVSASHVPLRWPYYASQLLSVAFLLSLTLRLCYTSTPDATFDTIMIALLVGAFGLANLLAHAVVAAYIARIHTESLRRPLYVILETVGLHQNQTRDFVHS